MFVKGKRWLLGISTIVNVESIRGYSVLRDRTNIDGTMLVRFDIILTGRRAWLRSGKKTCWITTEEFKKIKK